MDFKDRIEKAIGFRKVSKAVYRHQRRHVGNRLPPSHSGLSIHITTNCDQKCPQCSSLVHQAPCSEMLTAIDVKNILDDSNRSKKQWETIIIYGGEPTLHPEFYEIMDVIAKYREGPYPPQKIFLITHGIGSRTIGIINSLPSWVLFDRTTDDMNIKIEHHRTMTVAPIDIHGYEDADFSTGCWLSSVCGRAVATNGYFPCNPGVHIDRVAGLNVGIKDPKEGIESDMLEQKKALCRLCGLFIFPFRYSNGDEMSPTWEKILKKYNSRK